ncbi:polyamine ABC transporter substrate-binding protein [Kushneria phyllosphaerae]|uniref:Putrescine-binding periplasmic protein n=1 Tax=Kushneria phyllosphaerae TaxID=2100822 RepID=A0A2R8CQP1_9GAMM|nr:spermidine/putrescine ABC transporter substrate-binding protein [Kushneria phyllosphaerae]SPJ35113.1 Spermidine/putrescine-binding periplasmic protein [Kushneria phyllosphaerae]
MTRAWRWRAGVLLLAGASLTAGAAEKPAETLYLFNWTEYMPPGVLEDFEREHNVHIVQNFFTSNAEMFTKLRSGGDAQYDVVVPTDYFVPRLIKADLIQPLDHAQLPGLENLLPEFQDPAYDPGNRYSVPYQWGVTGIVYDSRVLDDVPRSWSALFDPDVNSKAPFTLLGGDPQVLFGAACASLGYGFDCTQKEQWIASARRLMATKHRQNFIGFTDSTATIDQIVRGVSAIGMTYNGDLAWRQAEDPETYGHLRFFVPEEGTQRGIDTLVIPKRAPHPALALAFIAYTLRPDVAARISNYTFYATPNQAALDQLDDALKKPPSRLSDEEKRRLVFVPLIDKAQLGTLSQLNNEMRSR